MNLTNSIEPYYDRVENYLPTAGRVFLGGFFYFQGLSKILGGFFAFVSMVEGLGVPFATPVAGLVVSIEILGGLLIVAGYKSEAVAIFLAAYLMVVNLVVHQFWVDMAQINPFMKNIGLIGGLVLMTKTGSGGCSLDFCLQNQEDSESS